MAVLSVGRETLRGGERLARRLYYGLRALNYDVGAARGPLAAQECGLAGFEPGGRHSGVLAHYVRCDPGL